MKPPLEDVTRPVLKPAHLRAEQARLVHRIESLEAHRVGLDRATKPFGESTMDPEKWRRAFHSGDPDDIVARNGLTGCYSALVNGYIELIKSGAYLAGLTPHKKDRAKNAIDLLRDELDSRSNRPIFFTSFSCSRVGSSMHLPTSMPTKFARRSNYFDATQLL
ncbi:MAG TPA: hypothetical protein VFI03_04030 [Solirubrobacterales bacterium]|nr:hypothetical protein [Solirubrobacterales bacterium]